MAVCLVAAGCSSSGLPELSLTAVEPSSGSESTRVAVRILGHGLLPLVRADYEDDERSVIDSTFSARLGDVDLDAVSRLSNSELTATVPATLPAGLHPLTVIDPRGRVATLQDAYEVLSAAADGGPDGGADGPVVDQGADAIDAAAPDGTADASDAALPDAPPPDAPPDVLPPDVGPPDLGADATTEGPACPVACVNGCAGGVCELDCTVACTCPPGLPCAIDCSTTGACPGDIDCGQAASCEVKCSGSNSCTGAIDCSGTGDCTIVCSGNTSCQDPITCGAGFCDVNCNGGDACDAGVDCSASCGCKTDALAAVCPPACAGCGLLDACDDC